MELSDREQGGQMSVTAITDSPERVARGSSAVTGSAWVCIAERLPECKKVVVLFKDKSMLIANGEKITDQFAEYCQITHWLEIPATPNVELSDREQSKL